MLDFEKSFGDFIDSSKYDKAESLLFSLIRASYTAGWLAAGGKAPTREAAPDKPPADGE